MPPINQPEPIFELGVVSLHVRVKNPRATLSRHQQRGVTNRYNKGKQRQLDCFRYEEGKEALCATRAINSSSSCHANLLLLTTKSHTFPLGRSRKAPCLNDNQPTQTERVVSGSAPGSSDAGASTLGKLPARHRSKSHHPHPGLRRMALTRHHCVKKNKNSTRKSTMVIATKSHANESWCKPPPRLNKTSLETALYRHAEVAGLNRNKKSTPTNRTRKITPS